MKHFYLFIFLFLSGNLVTGQNIKFKTLSTDDGLSNNSVNDVISDKDGVLWIATWDGLNKYDGHKFTIFKHSQTDSTSIAANEINNLLIDDKGTLWVITNVNSISKYTGNGIFKNYSFDTIPKEIFLSKQGRLVVWIAEKDIYYEYKEGKFEVVSNQLFQQKETDVLNTILISKYPELIINKTLKDSKGNIWYATRYNGLYVIPNNTSNIRNEVVDHYEYDMYSPYSFTSNEIVNLHEDNFGNVWLAHKDGGLSMAYEGSQDISMVSHHPINYPHLPNETIRAITKDNASNVWLGYYTQGLYYYNSSTQCYVKHKLIRAEENKDWDRIRSLFTSSDGTVWIGTYAGIARVRNGVTSYFKAEEIENLPENRNYSMFEDAKKQLWISCWGGLAKFDLKTQKFVIFKGQEALTNVQIRKVVVYDNEIVLGTENKGVLLLDTNTGGITEINSSNGILGNSVYTVFKDEKTNFYWIASLGGISVYDLKKGIIKNITEKESLPSHMVYSLIVNENKVWISTTKGIAVVDKENYTVLSLNPDEGWQAPEFSEGAYFQDRKGTLFFGGINGLNYFHPNKINFNKQLPNIQVKIDNVTKIPETIIRNYSENNFEVAINPISFSENANNKIVYKLEGYDKEWNVFSQNPVFYTKIPSGEYTLVIKNFLEINEANNVKVSFKIKKPFFETAWFYILVVVLIGVIIAYLFISKNKKNIKYQQELERKITERTQIINSQKLVLETANSELDKRNKEIFERKEQLLKLHHQLRDEDFEIEKFKTFIFAEFKPLISDILENSNRLVNQDEIKEAITNRSGKLVNLLLEWDYLGHVKDLGESKKTALKLNSLLKELLNDLKVKVLKSKVNLDYTIDFKDQWVELDVLRFKLVFKYLFNVVIKYATINSRLVLRIRNEGDFIVMEVCSNSKVLADNIFSIQHYSPYFKAVKALLVDVNGTIEIESSKELNFLLKIPIAGINLNGGIQEEIRWNQLSHEEELPTNKQNVLVFCNNNDFLLAKQILEESDSNLVFEDSFRNVLSLLKHKKFDGLVVYNSRITHELVQLLNSIKGDNRKVAIPIVYISEQINYFLQEEMLELGVDAFIQLPISKSFIRKKLGKLLEVRENYLQEKSTQQFFTVTKEQDQSYSPNEKLVNIAMEIVKKNIDDSSFNVEKLTSVLGVSKIKCYRIFKEVLKQSPSDVIIKLRLQKAAYLLQNKPLNISEISFACGFNDPKYFSRLFRKNYGCSPKEYKSKKSYVVD